MAAEADVRVISDHLRELAETSLRERVPLARLVERLGPSSYAVVCLVLTVPFLQPVPLGPYATVAGLAFAALGRQMLRGETSVRLPERVGSFAPGPRVWRGVHRLVSWMVGLGGRFGRSRLPEWTAGRYGRWWAGALILTGGLLIMLPFLAVPLNNTLPALIVVCAALARIHRDALYLAFAVLWLKVTLVYFGFVIWGLWVVGEKGAGLMAG